jgi:hypothetical protein
VDKQEELAEMLQEKLVSTVAKAKTEAQLLKKL